MNNFSELPPEEQINLIWSFFNLDQDIVEKFIEPRKQIYGDEVVKVLNQEDEKQHEKTLALSFTFCEAIVRNEIRNVYKFSIENNDIVNRLLPFHKDLQTILEQARLGIFDFSISLTKIFLQEKSTCNKLLEELTQIIRQHTPNADTMLSSEEPFPGSPIQNVAKQVQEKVLNLRKQETILVTIIPSELQKVVNAILPYIDPKQEQTVLQLFTTGTILEPIYFNESRLMLGDFFRRLKDKKMLIGVVFYTELAKWLSQHFYIKNKKKKGFTPVNEQSIKNLMQNGEKPNHGVILI